MSKFEKYLGGKTNEALVQAHKKLLTKAMPTRDWRGAWEQLGKVGATEYNGYQIVATFTVIDVETGKEISGKGLLNSWNDVKNQVDYDKKNKLPK